MPPVAMITIFWLLCIQTLQNYVGHFGKCRNLLKCGNKALHALNILSLDTNLLSMESGKKSYNVSLFFYLEVKNIFQIAIIIRPSE